MLETHTFFQGFLMALLFVDPQKSQIKHSKRKSSA